MAAAEYFSNAPMARPSNAPYQSPTLQPIANHPMPHLQTQQPPPPYEDPRPGVHFAPTPSEVHQRHSFSHQQRPSFSAPQNTWSQPSQQQYQYPQPQLQNAMVLQQRPPHQSYGAPTYNPDGYGTPPQRPQYLSPQMRPYANPNASQYSLTQGGYSSDPEPHRRRHKHKSRRDNGETRETRDGSSKSGSRSRNTDAFLGAAGGGLIGDLIFPGLGTVGGAALGWLGGKDYGHHRKGRERQLDKDQRKWEGKFRPELQSSRGRRDSSRSSSTYLGESDRWHSHERRKSYN